MISINALGIIWFILVLYSFSRKIDYTIMLTVVSIIFQVSLFVAIGNVRISIFEMSAFLLIFRYFILAKGKLVFSKTLKNFLIVALLFFIISIIDGMLFEGYEIKLYAEYMGLYRIGTEKLSIDYSLIIALFRFTLYGIVYEVISCHVKRNNVCVNDRNMLNTLRLAIYIVCIVGLIQILTSNGYLNLNSFMTVIHDERMGAASAYYANYTRLFSTFAEPSYCAPWLNAALWAMVYCRENINKLEKRILIVILSIEFILSASATGYLAMIVMFLYYVYTNRSKKSFLVVVFLVFSAIIWMTITPMGKEILLYINDKATSTSGLSRFAYIQDCYCVFAETHFMGLGYMQIKCMTLLSGLFAQVGLIGTIVFCRMIVYLIRNNKRNTNAQRVSYVFFITMLIGSEISCSGLAYLATFWFAFLLLSMTNYHVSKIVIESVEDEVANV